MLTFSFVPAVTLTLFVLTFFFASTVAFAALSLVLAFTATITVAFVPSIAMAFVRAVTVAPVMPVVTLSAATALQFARRNNPAGLAVEDEPSLAAGHHDIRSIVPDIRADAAFDTRQTSDPELLLDQTSRLPLCHQPPTGNRGLAHNSVGGPERVLTRVATFPVTLSVTLATVFTFPFVAMFAVFAVLAPTVFIPADAARLFLFLLAIGRPHQRGRHQHQCRGPRGRRQDPSRQARHARVMRVLCVHHHLDSPSQVAAH